MTIRNPLCREVLTRGHTAKFSHMVDLVSTTLQVKDAMRYDMGACQSKVQHRAAVPLQPIPTKVWAQPPHPVPSGNRNRKTTGRKPATAAQLGWHHQSQPTRLVRNQHIMPVTNRLHQSVTDVASLVTSVLTVCKDRESHALQRCTWLTKGKRIIPRRRYCLRFLKKKMMAG